MKAILNENGITYRFCENYGYLQLFGDLSETESFYINSKLSILMFFSREFFALCVYVRLKIFSKFSSIKNNLCFS